MSVRMNYIMLPIDYIRELKSTGNRAKARSFMEYYDDYEVKEINSFGFYAKSWGISKTQVQAWIKEFKNEIERFFSYWLIKNSQHYSSIQKQTDRLPTTNRPIDTEQMPIQSSFKKTDRPTTDRPPTEAFNLNNGDNARVNFYDKDFEDLYIRARRFNKFTGNKEDAYNEYINYHTHISHGDMAYAYMIHINDPKCNGKVFNLTNFMKNNVYVSYLNPRIQVLTEDGKMIEGWYNQSLNSVTPNQGKPWELTKERFTELVTKGNIVILNKMKAAV